MEGSFCALLQTSGQSKRMRLAARPSAAVVRGGFRLHDTRFTWLQAASYSGKRLTETSVLNRHVPLGAGLAVSKVRDTIAGGSRTTTASDVRVPEDSEQ